MGRFLSVDPITREYPELTPFQFAGNRPIRAVDLDGLEPLDFNMGGYLTNWFGDGLIGMADWLDETLSLTSKPEIKQTVNKVKIGSVTNQTTIKNSVTTTIKTNLSSKVKYIKTNNTSEEDPSPLVKTKSKLEVAVENKTSVKTTKGFTTVTVYNSTSTTNDGKVKNTTGVNIEGIVEGIPVVNKTSISKDSEGVTEASTSVGVGTSDNNAGVIFKTSSDQNGANTTSVGVTSEGTSNSTGISNTVTIDINTKPKN